MRLIRIAVALLVLLGLIPLALPAVADSNEPWVFEGGGWGHGVGLSQYGSQGMALDGYSAKQIIDFYYSGAEVQDKDAANGEPWLDDPEAIWVGISQNRTSRTFEAYGGPIDVCQKDDESITCDTISDGQVLTVAVVEASDPVRCERSVDGGPPIEGDCWVDITWDESVTERRVLTAGLELARGSVRVRPNHTENPTAFHVSVSVGLEKYIYGIAETLLHWEDEALKTQAIIARSYGVDKALTSANSDGDLWSYRKHLCWCHIGSTVSDQNYDGWDFDTEGSAPYGQAWRDAVKDTAGMIVTHPEHPGGTMIISTYYSSSNGGASENIEDVWGGDPLPWLRSVEDQWSSNPNLNPLAKWTVLVSDENMAAALGWDYVFDAEILQGPPGVEVRFTGKDDGIAVETVRNGTQIRSILNAYGYLAGGGNVRVSPFITAVTDPPGFDDIAGTTFENAIDWLADEKITVGCNPPDNDMYCPDAEVTRGQMAVFISRVLELDDAAADHFTDDTGKFYEGAANRIFEAGIVNGCGNGKFCGDQVLRRDQMAKFLARAIGLPASSVDHFVDDSGNTFETKINSIAEARITLGCNPPTNDRYCPADHVTRGQMAAFFYRAWGP